MHVHSGQTWRDRLLSLGRAVRSELRRPRVEFRGETPFPHKAPASGHTAALEEDPTSALGVQGGDTIFGLDRSVEPVILRAVEEWALEEPLLLIMEGLGKTGIQRLGDPDAPLRYRLIVDPIDGTRCLMHEKRSAWFLAAVADEADPTPTLRSCFASVMVELPTAKQGYADELLAIRHHGLIAHRLRLDEADEEPLVFLPRPSQATNLLHGFAQVTNHLYDGLAHGAQALASELMETICKATLHEAAQEPASVFQDQYLSTGGQFAELILGRDRFCCDLRPLFHRILAKEDPTDELQVRETRGGLTCHPYDAAGLLVAEQAGVIITDGFGHRLDAPLDVDSEVHWCGYANQTLQRQIEPILQIFLHEHGLM